MKSSCHRFANQICQHSLFASSNLIVFLSITHASSKSFSLLTPGLERLHGVIDRRKDAIRQMDSKIEAARKNLQAAANNPSNIVPSKENSMPDQITTRQVDIDAQTILDLSAQQVECARTIVELLNEAESEILREIRLTETDKDLIEGKKLRAAAISKEPIGGPERVINEDHICICGGGAVGDMVQCDNPSCPFEWFHNECVGLSQADRRSDLWFCPYCAAMMRQTDHVKNVPKTETVE